MPKVSIIVPLYNAERRLDISMESIASQTHRDIEVIMIDDGSKDRSVELANKWCDKDSRFKLLVNSENKGVSVTRNRGLDVASGEYIRFIDADDTIPADSTEQMLKVAAKYDSDLVIGIMRRETAASTYRFARTERLAKQKIISPYDDSLNYSFSVCNKLFKREIIEREKIRFEKYKLAEDGLFLFSFISYCNSINGCNKDVYSYYKNETFEDESSSDVYTLDMLEGILEIAEKIQYMNYDAPLSFFDNFLRRIVEITLVHECYRKLWIIDEETEELLISSFNKLWSRLPEKQKNAIRNIHRDLQLQDKLPSKQEIIKNPIFTIAISRNVSEAKLNRLLASIYGQKNPSFVIYIEEALLESTPKEYVDCGNIFSVNARSIEEFYEKVIERSGDGYITFVENNISYSKDALANAGKELKTYECVSAYLEVDKQICPELHGIYETICKEENSEQHQVFDAMDFLLSNRFFSIKALKENNIVFTDERKQNLLEINRLLSHKRIRGIIIYLNESISINDYRMLVPESVISDYNLVLGNRNVDFKDSKDAILNYVKDSIIHPATKRILFVPEGDQLIGPAKEIYSRLKAPKAIAQKGIYLMSEHEKNNLFKRYKMLVFEGACPELDYGNCPSDQISISLVNSVISGDGEIRRMTQFIDSRFASLCAIPDRGITAGLKRTKKLLYGNKRFRTQFFRAFGKLFRKFIPLNEKLVFFLSDMRGEMGGNMKYVYDNMPEGYKAYTYFTSEKWELKSLLKYIALIYRMNRCKYILLEDFFTPLEYMRVRKGQEIVQLWHGAGAFKRFAYGRAKRGERLNIHSGYKKYSKAIVSSPQIRGIYSNSYNIRYDNVQATGIPRTDFFYDKAQTDIRKAEIYAAHPEFEDKKIILIAPTYRGTTLNSATYDYSKLGLADLKKILGDEYICITAWHPAIYNSIAAGRTGKPDYSGCEGFVYDLSDQFGTDELMLIADVLITDYSSIIFDYSLLDKPIIFYAYDMDLYTGDRGLYYDFEEYIYGQLVTRREDLAEAILNAKVNTEAAKRFREKFMESCDGNSSQKTVDYIFNNKRPSDAPCEYAYSVIYYCEQQNRTAAEISESLRSLVNQSIEKKQVQLISAGEEIPEVITREFGSFVLVDKGEKETMPSVLNKCLDKCKGEALVFLKDGDRWNEEALDRALRHINQNKNDADVFICNSVIASDKPSNINPQLISESLSGLINLRRLSNKINQLEGNFIIRSAGIKGVNFNENLSVGYMQTFYSEAVSRALKVYYMDDVGFVSANPNYITERKELSLGQEKYKDYIKECYQRLINNDYVLYGGVTRYLQTVIMRDINAGIPSDISTADEDYDKDYVIEDILKEVAVYIDGGALGDCRSYNPNLANYISHLKKHDRKYGKHADNDSAELWVPMTETIEQEDFKVLIIRALGKKLHLEGYYTSPASPVEESPNLTIVDEKNNHYQAELKPYTGNDASDYLGRKLVKGYTFSVDLPATIGTEYSFRAGSNSDVRNITPFYGVHSSFPKYIDEGRVRDSDIIICREKGKLMVVEPSDNMCKRIDHEKGNSYLNDVVSFVSVRGSELQDNLQLVRNGIQKDIHSDTFSAMRPLNYEKLKDIKRKVYHSKVIVTDDYIWLYREREKTAGQKLVQLWHACGAFKKFGVDGTSMFPSIDALTHQYYDMVSVSSEHLRDVYANAFGISKEKVRALGVPRTDFFFDEMAKNRVRDEVYKKHPEFKDKQIIMYAPTFRDTGQGSRREFVPDLIFEELSSALSKKQLFVICPHPVMTSKILEKKYDNILEVRDVTTNEMMMVADLLITDYSSVIFEFSLLKKPMAFYCYDYDEYDRDFYLDYEKDLPGPIFRTQAELHKFIKKGLFTLGDGYKEFVNKFMGACDGNSTERIAKTVENIYREG